MDEEIQKPEPKISDAEIILIGLFYGVLDLIDIIPIAGDITDVVAAPMGFYYWNKGISGTGFLAAEILDLIPVVQEIPSRTISWGITVWLDRHPKIQAELAPALKIAGALEGNMEGAEGAAATESQELAAGTATAANSAIMAESNTALANGTGETGGRDGGAATSGARGGSGSIEGGSGEGKTSDNRPSEGEGEGEQNMRPSERESGRPSERRQDDRMGEIGEEQGGGSPGESEEERRRKSEEERYNEITTPDTARDPVDVAKRDEFSNVIPIDRSRAAEPEEKEKENPTKKKLEERLAKQQAKFPQQEEGGSQLPKAA